MMSRVIWSSMRSRSSNGNTAETVEVKRCRVVVKFVSFMSSMCQLQISCPSCGGAVLPAVQTIRRMGHAHI